MRLAFYFLFLLFIALVLTIAANAQTCTGSLGAPVINETFGAGATYGVGPQLDPGLTNLKYIADGCGGEDGTYTLLTSMGSSCKGGTWKYIPHDHTGDANGYMMIINADITPSVFFTYTAPGNKLCPNTTYQFAAYISNILRDLPGTQGYSQPNITFSIETPDGKVLKTYNTGDIKADDDAAHWTQYGTFFTSPADGSDVIVKMTNNGSGGNGNDLAIDDITFSPCGPLIQTGFGTINNNADKNTCAGDKLTYTLVAEQTGYIDPTYQWQQNYNDGKGWINIPGATSLSLDVSIPNALVGEYQYRIGILNKASIGAESCRIFSDPLNINVYPIPIVPLVPNTSACIGQPLKLSASGGDSYLWTGPNNFSSTAGTVIVTQNANASYTGDYTVKVTQSNCPFFATTTVKVYPPVTVQPMNDVAICEGDNVQLAVTSANGTTFKWYPADGLDHDDIPDPIASPKVTTKYTAYVSNSGCPDYAPQSTVTVTVNKRPAAAAGKSIKMFQGQQTRLNGTAAGDNISTYWTPSDYLDDPSSLTPLTSATHNITYTLHVVSNVGCGQSTNSVFVRVYKKIIMANTFTPNGDGINDYWDIKNFDDYPNASIAVYDRYGQLVFQSIDYSKPWDGTYNGKKLPAGTYYYIIDLKDDNLPKQAGWVLIIR